MDASWASVLYPRPQALGAATDLAEILWPQSLLFFLAAIEQPWAQAYYAGARS